MLAELHAHTSYSIGKKVYHHGLDTPLDMLKYAKKRGLDAIAITDHDVMDGAFVAKKLSKKIGIHVIVGEEISTKQGHVLALGIYEHIKPNLDFENTLDKIHEQGGLAISAHPFDINKDGLRKLSKKCDAVEVFNALNMDRISNRICEKFASKNSLKITAGSDAHCKEMLGYGAIRCDCEAKTDSIIEAIRKGRVDLIKKYPPVKTIEEYAVRRLRMSYDYTVKYINSHYNLPKRYISKKLMRIVKASPGKMDYIFRLLGYTALFSAYYYSIFFHVAKNEFIF